MDCALEIRPSQAGAVYAGTPGRIVWTVQPGTEVRVGDKIAILENPDLQIRLADYRGEEEVETVKLRNLSLRSSYDQSLKASIETQVELLHSLASVRAKTEEELERLVIRANRDGFVLPPPERDSKDSGDGRLPGWTGSPLDERNRGAMLTADDLICEIGGHEAFEAAKANRWTCCSIPIA